MRYRALCSTMVMFMLVHSALAQALFQEAFGPMVTSGGFKVSRALRHQDGTWTMRGGTGQVSLLHLAQDGAPLWLNDYDPSQASTFALLVTTAPGPDQSTMAVFIDTLETIGTGLRRRRMGLARIAANGNVDWARRYRYDMPGQMYITSDGHQMTVAPDGGFFTDGGEPSAASVMHFTNAGSLSWARTLNDPDGVGKFRGLVDDGSGGCYFLAGYASEALDSSKVIVGRFNSNGSLVWNRKIEPVQVGRQLEPLKLLRLQDGSLLVIAMEYGGGVIGSSVLLRITATGTVSAAHEYGSTTSGSLDVYKAVQRSDGHLWMTFQAGGYGLVRIDPSGAVQETLRFNYRSEPEGMGVLALEELLMHEDELGVLGRYQIYTEFGADPGTDFIWNRHAFDLDLCHVNEATITHALMPLSDLLLTSTTTATGYTVVEEPMTLTASALTLPTTLPFCPIYVGLDGTAAIEPLHVWPTLVPSGESFTIDAHEKVVFQVTDAHGRTVVDRTELALEHAHTVNTSGWAPGLYLVRAVGRNGSAFPSMKVLVH